MSHMADKLLDIYEEGEDAWLNGTANPYKKGSPEWHAFEEGWKAVNRYEEAKADAECE